MRIEIVPYSPSWPDQFTAIQQDLQAILTTNSIPFLSIEHVGSTSVPNLDAKPILDIDIIITRPQLAAIILASKDAGYTHHGEWGIPDRHAFRDDSLKPTTNLYVCIDGCLAVRNHLATRDVLRKDEALREEYARVT